MAFKAAAPCTLLREHLLLNPGSFVATSGINTASTADDFVYLSRVDYIPNRIQRTNEIQVGAGGVTTFVTFDDRHVHDSTTYATNPTTDSWQVNISGSASVANTKGLVQGGQFT